MSLKSKYSMFSNKERCAVHSERHKLFHEPRRFSIFIYSLNKRDGMYSWLFQNNF